MSGSGRSRRFSIWCAPHFHALLEIISSEKGAVVKTIGDAVMATFIRPEHAIVAGLRMSAAMDALNVERGTDDLWSRSAFTKVRASPSCSMNGRTISVRPSYRGRVQGVDLASHPYHRARWIDAPAVAAILDGRRSSPDFKAAALRGHRRQDSSSTKYPEIAGW